MLTKEGLKQTKTVIVGLGKTGFACARFLSRMGVPVAVTDSRVDPPMLEKVHQELPDLPMFLGGFDQNALNQAQLIVISPGVSLNEPEISQAIEKGVPVVGEIEIFCRFAEAPVIAITGSNGKSTVTTLVGEMATTAGLNVSVGGNLGTPALDLIGDEKPDWYVLELSSFQLETVSDLKAHAAVILNVSEDHMDRYNDFNDYIEAKFKVFNGDGIVVENLDEVSLHKLLEKEISGRKVITYSITPDKKADFTIVKRGGEKMIVSGNESLLAVKDLKLPGSHNLSNVLAAFALAETMGADKTLAAQAARDFNGLPHRMQWVGESNGVRWFNDSKATNVGATAAAVAGMDCPIVLIAGGDGKGADFSPLAQVMDNGVRQVVLIGRDGPLINDAIKDRVPTCFASDMQDAVRQAAEVAKPGDVVLLSPACASFDMYNSYEQRGHYFISAVQEVIA